MTTGQADVLPSGVNQGNRWSSTIEWEVDGATVQYELRARRIIAVANQKGGVFKTASSINVAASLAAHGVPVLLLDLDPQANATSGFGLDPEEAEATMYEVLHPKPAERVSIDQAAIEVRPGLWVVPGHLALAAIEEYGNGPGGELLIRRALSKTTIPWRVVLMDCPPNLGRMTVSAFAAAEEVDVMIPVKCGPDELKGLANLLDSIEKIKENGLVSEIQPRYVYATQYDGRQKLDQGVDEYLERNFPGAYVNRPIRKSTDAVKAKANHVPVREFAPREPVVGDYDELARTVVERRLAK